ncbi:MAG: flagellar motor switch protein FliN [Gammaproteobacteria bacterium]|nr:flagellar motor switch protein FliN [Gammaproteobacteria bacterium]
MAGTEQPKNPPQSDADGARAQFSELAGEAAQGGGVMNIDLLLDVPLALTLEVGRTQIAVRDLLALSQGSIVELEKLAGEPLDVLVNGTLVAQGEVVVVNEKFGIRLLDVVSRAERVGTLQE